MRAALAQATEAYLSKLFALSYSIASISVASGNPLDHLVHRYTHRVVRGSLLAVGRPDGRLNALSASENTCCLSVNQASSIQNYGVTCESITLGHNPSGLPLTANNIFLPRLRPLFFSEHVVEAVGGMDSSSHHGKGSSKRSALSAGALMGKLTGKGAAQADEDDNGINDVFDEVIAKLACRGGTPPEQSRCEEVYRRIEPLKGEFVGSWMAFDERYRGMTNQELLDRQRFIQTLYETRIASLHRFVGFLVLFHAMGKAVQDFWPRVSCGLLRYDMSRTHSIMRIATTASPVSGMEVGSAPRTRWDPYRMRPVPCEPTPHRARSASIAPRASRLQRATRIAPCASRHAHRATCIAPRASPHVLRAHRCERRHSSWPIRARARGPSDCCSS